MLVAVRDARRRRRRASANRRWSARAWRAGWCRRGRPARRSPCASAMSSARRMQRPPSGRRCRSAQPSVLSASLSTSDRPSGSASRWRPAGQLERPGCRSPAPSAARPATRRPRPARRSGPAAPGWPAPPRPRRPPPRPGTGGTSPRKPAQRVALAQPVADAPPQPQRALAGLGRVLPAVDTRQLVGQPVVQLGHRGRVERRPRSAAPARTAPPPPGASRARPPARAGRAARAEHRRRRRPPPRRGRPCRRRRRCPAAQSAARIRGVHAGAGGAPGPPARPPAGRARGGTAAPRRRRPAARSRAARRRTGGPPVDRVQQPQVDPGADQRRDVEHGRGRVAQPGDPGQHRVPGRRAAPSPVPAAHHLGDVERVAAGEPVQLGRLQPAAGGQHPTACADSGASPIRRVERWVASSPSAMPERVGRRQRRRRGRSRSAAPAASRSRAARNRSRSRVASSAQCRSSRTTTLSRSGRARPGAAARRTARPGRRRPRHSSSSSPPSSAAKSNSGPSGRGVNRPSQTPQAHRAAGSSVASRSERLDQRRLADPGLAGDQDQPAVAGARLLRVLGQRGQRGLPFQQRHGHQSPAPPTRTGRSFGRHRPSGQPAAAVRTSAPAPGGCAGQAPGRGTATGRWSSRTSWRGLRASGCGSGRRTVRRSHGTRGR